VIMLPSSIAASAIITPGIAGNRFKNFIWPVSTQLSF